MTHNRTIRSKYQHYTGFGHKMTTGVMQKVVIDQELNKQVPESWSDYHRKQERLAALKKAQERNK